MSSAFCSADDPSPGNFTLELDPREKRVQILSSGEIYWKAGPWTDDANVSDFTTESFLYNFTIVSELNMNYLTYYIYRKDIISRFAIDVTGQFKQFLWLENEWTLFNSQPRQLCDVYAYCGANASCTNVSLPYCSCLPGFQPISLEGWNKGDYSRGCSRKTDLQCGNDTNIKGAGDGFLKLFNVVLPKKQLTLEVQSIGECRSSCLSNCSCTGFSYTDQNCSIWTTALINLQQLPADDISGRDFFLKLAAADLETRKGTGNKRKQSIIISVTISVTIFTSALLIWQVRKKKQKRKVHESVNAYALKCQNPYVYTHASPICRQAGENLLLFELSVSPAPTKNEQSEVKGQGKQKKEEGFGYMAPEYALEGVFSVKSDVFSFGVLMLEVLSGKKNTGFYQSNSFSLLGYVSDPPAWDLWTSSWPLELMESVIQDSSFTTAAIRYINIALLCVQERAEDRPTMSDVVSMLSNELTVLPSPMKPAFSNVRSMVDPNSSPSKPEICSANELTLSVLNAR
ncbi:hypothetical protein SCA6_018498 [Theobroma cacao]